MSDLPVHLTCNEGIAHLVLDSPPKNELDFRTLKELTRLRRKVIPSLSIQGMVVYGAGRHFSSGANITELNSLYFSSTAEDPVSFLDDTSKTLLAIERLHFPVIAIINGCCLGLGLELALACHYRLASSRAIFGLPESSYGLMPGCGGTIRLPCHVSRGKAIELVISGRCIGSEEALNLGLVNACIPKNELLNAAITLIKMHEKRKIMPAQK